MSNGQTASARWRCWTADDEAKGKTMLEGYFGSLYKGVLVLRVPGHAWWYVLHVQDRELQWSMYCKDARIVPAHSGEVTNVECLGQQHRLSCWRVVPGNYVSESMRIADDLEAQCGPPNLELTGRPGSKDDDEASNRGLPGLSG